MKVADLVKFSADMLKQLHENGIKVDDYKFLDMYREYERLKHEGNKTVFIVAKLSERFGVCERLVYKVLRRFRRECQNGAVG